MRPSTRSVVPVTLAALVLATIPAGLAAQDTGDHTYTSSAVEAGSRVYTAECALCHGANGDEVDGIDLRTGQFRNARSDDDLRRVIREGLEGSRMPAFDLATAEMDGVVAFIRAGFDPEGVAVRIGDPARGQRIFEGAGGCADCHRVQGVGPRTAPDLSDIGAIRTPSALQRTLLDPAGSLRAIDRPVRIVTRGGEVITGRRLNEDTYSVQLIDRSERLRSLLKADLAEYEVGTTPSKEPSSLSPDQLADLIGYLLTLRGAP